MQKISAGLLMYRKRNNELEFFLVHHGGPYWKNRDEKSWSIPKGEINDREDLFECAKREFLEETSVKIETDKFISLGEVKQKSGKIVHAWAFEGDWTGILRQNIIEIEYPFGSGKKIKIPEIDKAEFFNREKAKIKMIEAQFEFIERLENKLKIMLQNS
jgi:predicted NUDIX family NTP pyrophosphohydrolase